jgi:hypothetical protein
MMRPRPPDRADGFENLIKRDHHKLELAGWFAEPQRSARNALVRSRHRDGLARDLVLRKQALGHEHRPIAIPMLAPLAGARIDR